MKKLTNFINEAEKSKKQKEYQEFFDKKLKKFDVDSPAKLSDADKKKFFNEIEKEWDQEPTNEKQVEEDYDSEEDEDSKEMKAKKESYESKDKEKDKEELYSSEDEEMEESEDEEMEEDSYNESSKKKIKEGLNSYVNKSVKSKKRDYIKNPKIGDSVAWEDDRGNLFRGTIEKIEGNNAIIDHMNSNRRYVKRQVDKTKLFNEGVYEAKKIKEKDAKKRLEQIRKSLRKEDLSYGEIAELEALSDFIEADDIELRQAAGLPEVEYDMDGNILEHEKGETAEISISKDEMEKLHKGGKVDIDKNGVIFSLIFKA